MSGTGDAMFFGFPVTGGKTTTFELEFAMHLSNAVVDPKMKNNERVFIVVDQKVDTEGDQDSDDEEETQSTVLCCLQAGKQDNATLNHYFSSGDTVSFSLIGNGTVHLSGFAYEDVDTDMDDMEAQLAAFDDEDDEEEDDEEEEEQNVGEKRQRGSTKKEKTPKKKAKTVESESSSSSSSSAEASASKKKAKKEKRKAQQEKAKKEKEGMDVIKNKDGRQRELPSGLVIKEVLYGTGKAAKRGATVQIHYRGYFPNGKEFDRSRRKPLKFRLGTGQVIAGFDQGVNGMQIGGKRTIRVPPHLGYGSRRTGDIPGNSTLMFDVELVSIN